MTGQSAEVITSKSIVPAGRKMKFSVAGSDKKRVKMKVKAEMKMKAYIMSVVDEDMENKVYRLLHSIL